MKLTFKPTTLSTKALVGYILITVMILALAVPVLANTTTGSNLLDFSRSATTGHSMQSAQTLSKGINLNHLNPGQENWYIYSRNSFQDPNFSWVSLALRTESEAIVNADQVNFEVFTAEAGSWFKQAKPATEPLGTGLASPLRADNANRLETFWTGQVGEQDNYFVRVFNNSPFGLDYTLEAKAEQAAVSGATPASFNTASSAIPQNIQQMSWTLTAQAVEKMPASEAAAWMQQAQAAGWIVTAGTATDAIPNPAKTNPQTLWRLAAQAIAGQKAEDAARWLSQADSLGWLAIPPNTAKQPLVEPAKAGTGGSGGGDKAGSAPPPAVPVAPKTEYQPVNIYPNNPLPFDVNKVNSGRLAPYGEHWYSLLRDDLDSHKIENMKMTMFFTPIQGYLSNRINFEIFPGSQYQIWQRGDADYMENLGVGMWVSRDNDPNTGERLWNGTLVDGDRYLIKIKNGTPEVVDYYLFPSDVQNAQLGNPTLYSGDISGGRVPYAASPPTRPGPPPVPGDGPPEAIPLKVGTTTGTLDAGKEMWYSFFFHNSGNGDKPNHDFKIYLTNTPTNEILARHADFAIYPGNSLQLWTRGTVDQLEPLGTSAPSPFPVKNVKSLQVLWDGQLMPQNIYYIKVFNHDIGPLNYELKISDGS